MTEINNTKVTSSWRGCTQMQLCHTVHFSRTTLPSLRTAVELNQQNIIYVMTTA